MAASLPGPDPQSVFLNVPFDPVYEPCFVTLVATLISLGQTPRCVLEVRETGQGRLTRIFELVRSCGVSMHDLSRVGVPVRFNMPFELGIACSLALSGEPHDIVVLDTARYRLDKTLSDYKGRDPLIYSNLGELVDAIADVFQVADEPAPDLLKKEARFLRKSASVIAASYGGTIFRRAAFRALVAAATRRAKSQGLIPA
jgi:hypothetical protein